MDIKLIRTVLFFTLAVIVVGCGGRAYQAEPTAPPETTETEAMATPEKTEPSQETATAVTPVKRQTGTVTASRLNLRNQASAKGAVVGVLQKGDRLGILSHKGNWMEITTSDGQKGWVYDRYVQTEKKGTGSSGLPKKTATPPKKVKNTKAETIVQPTPAKTLAPKTAPKKSPALRQQLEMVWGTSRQAYRDGDLALIRKVTSNHSYGTLQNELAAVGKELKPDDVTVLYKMMPDLAKFKFVEIKQDGPTVGMLYLDEGDKSDDPNLPPPVRFHFIKFVKETRGWTLDGTLSMREPKYQKDGSETRFDYTALPAELAIDGKVRPAPKAMAKPTEAMVEGALDISSYDYITRVSINGVPQRETEGASSSGAIKGGLKKGENNIEIVVTKSAKAQSDWEPEVTIRYLNSSGQEQEAFKFTPEKNVVGKHDFTFTVE